MAVAAATAVVLKRARVSIKRRNENEIFPSAIPDEKEWLGSHEVEMLMLDGWGCPFE